MALQVTVNIQSNKLQAGKDSFKYKVELNRANLWHAKFDAIVLQNSNLRYSNIDPNELIQVKRISDEEVIFVEYKLLSNFVNGESSEDNEIEALQTQVNNLESETESIKQIAESAVQPADLTWANVNDKPTQFPPSAHTHNAQDINAGNLNIARLPVLTQGNFLVGGSSATEQRKISPTDLGATAGFTGLRVISIQNDGFVTPYAVTSTAINSSLVIRTSTGQGKFNAAVNNDEAVVLSQLNAALPTSAQLVPTGGTNTTFLRGDGTWVTPTNTTYSVISQAEFAAGTATTARTVSAVSLNRDIEAKVVSYLLSLPNAAPGSTLQINATGDGFEWVAPA